MTPRNWQLVALLGPYLLVAGTLTFQTASAEEAPAPGSVTPACQNATTAACKLEFIGTWTGQWGDKGLRNIQFGKDGTLVVLEPGSSKPEQGSWFVPDVDSVVLVEKRDDQPPRLYPNRVSKSGANLVLQHLSFPPMVFRPQGEAKVTPSTDVALPITDPLALFALAQKLDPKSVIVGLKSCFSVNGCGRPKSPLNFTPDYDSVLTKIPSTRIIAALRDCAKIEAVQNDFQMRDLDIDTRAAVETAAKDAPTLFPNLVLTAQIGKYDFGQQGFPLNWQPSVLVYSGRKTCRGQQVADSQNEFPTDFYVYADEALLPKFVAVAPEKARFIVESSQRYDVQAVVSVDVRKFTKGILKIDGKGIATGWVFSGATTVSRLAWMRGGQVVEDIAGAQAPDATPHQNVPAPTVLKVDQLRIIKSDVNVRTTASKAAPLAAVLKPNQYVLIREKSADGLWSRVAVNNKDIGWILDSAFLKNSMTEEEAAAISEAGQFDDIEKPN